jgi:ribonuclease HI
MLQPRFRYGGGVSELTCARCGTTFTVPERVRERYPGWEPKLCRTCHSGAAPVEENRPVAAVLAAHTEGPDTGVFTDGSATPNPGPGGWGAVYVIDGEVVAQAYGHEPQTTNNRMELTAVAAGYDLVPDGTPAVVYSDSRLVIDTVTKWAAGWERQGWRRKTGPVENLGLVKAAYEELTRRSELRLEWIPAHAGMGWNEYADALTTAWLREGV